MGSAGPGPMVKPHEVRSNRPDSSENSDAALLTLLFYPFAGVAICYISLPSSFEPTTFVLFDIINIRCPILTDTRGDPSKFSGCPILRPVSVRWVFTVRGISRSIYQFIATVLCQVDIFCAAFTASRS